MKSFKSLKEFMLSEKESELDSITYSELYNFIENNFNAYNYILMPTLKGLAKFVKKGTYTSEEAIKSYNRVVDAAAKAYQKEYGTTTVLWSTEFNKATRNEVAKELEKEYKKFLEELVENNTEYSDAVEDTNGLNEQITTFVLKGNIVDFSTSSYFVKDKAINVLLKTNGFNNEDLENQLGASASLQLTFDSGFEAKVAYDIISKSNDVNKINQNDVNKLVDTLYKDIVNALKGNDTYKINKTAVNGFDILVDGIGVARVSMQTDFSWSGK